MELILASTSAYRHQLLERLGVPFRSMAPQVDEDAIKAQFTAETAKELAERLAIAKARGVAGLERSAVVIGSDQVAVGEDRLLGKPGTVAGAIEPVCIAHRDGWRLHTNVTTLKMRPLCRDEIERYVAAEQPLDCAGSYKLESRGIALFESIETADQTAIIGLPLIAVATMLRELGFAIP